MSEERSRGADHRSEACPPDHCHGQNAGMSSCSGCFMDADYRFPAVSFRTAFITGGSGFVGRNLIPYLRRIGVEVKALVRSETSSEVIFFGDPGFEFDISYLDRSSRNLGPFPSMVDILKSPKKHSPIYSNLRHVLDSCCRGSLTHQPNGEGNDGLRCSLSLSCTSRCISLSLFPFILCFMLILLRPLANGKSS